MEKYGTVPKRFTKAWWEYFWTYYKWFVIAGAIAVFMTIITLNQCANTVHYDFKLTFAGKASITEEKQALLADRLSEVIADCDGNGEKNVQIQNLSVTANAIDGEYAQAMAQKLNMEFIADDGALFIFSRDLVNEYLNDESVADMFVPVTDWATEPFDRKRLAFSGGVPYAAELSDSTLLKELGINGEGFYLMLRVQRDNEKGKSKSEIQRESAGTVANLLISK